MLQSWHVILHQKSVENTEYIKKNIQNATVYNKHTSAPVLSIGLQFILKLDSAAILLVLNSRGRGSSCYQRCTLCCKSASCQMSWMFVSCQVCVRTEETMCTIYRGEETQQHIYISGVRVSLEDKSDMVCLPHTGFSCFVNHSLWTN